MRLPDDIPELVAASTATRRSSLRLGGRESRLRRLSGDRLSATRGAGGPVRDPEPATLPSLTELCRLDLGDVGDDDDPVVQAAVRDWQPSVEVVLGRAYGEAQFETLTGVRVPLEDVPGAEQTDALLSSTVRLPPSLTHAAIALETPLGWARHPWLRRSRPLFLDEGGQTELGGRLVGYSGELGLEVAAVGRS